VGPPGRSAAIDRRCDRGAAPAARLRPRGLDVLTDTPRSHDGRPAGPRGTREPGARPHGDPELRLRVSPRAGVNLAPAEVRKEGVSFDLPIALGLLAATGAVKPERLAGLLVVGELALDGTIHPVRGVLPMALRARHSGLAGCAESGQHPGSRDAGGAGGVSRRLSRGSRGVSHRLVARAGNDEHQQASGLGGGRQRVSIKILTLAERQGAPGERQQRGVDPGDPRVRANLAGRDASPDFLAGTLGADETMMAVDAAMVNLMRRIDEVARSVWW
jgi:Subunit ChlI of Mg-chelatase